MKKVAIQGFSGCFHEEAARKFYEEHFDMVPGIVECNTFDDLFEAMDAGEADAAVMAIENTISGGLIPNFDLLLRGNAHGSGSSNPRILPRAPQTLRNPVIWE